MRYASERGSEIISSMRRDRAEVVLFGIKIVAFAVMVTGTSVLIRTNILEQMMTQPVVFFLMLDAFLIHVFAGASRREAFLTISLASVAYLVWLADRAPKINSWVGLTTYGSLLGLASLFVLSASALKLSGAAGVEKLKAFGRSSIFICMAIWAIPFLGITDNARPGKLDPFLYAFDWGFGAQPSFLLGQVSASHPALAGLELSLYLALALPLALVYIGHLRNPEWPVDLLHAFFLNSVIAYMIFWLFPAAGPSFAFVQEYPFHPPALSNVGWAPIIAHAMPNAIPSVHVSTALLIWFNSRPWPLARWFALLFLAFTIFATLGLGQHYVIDLIVAFPYALFIQSLGVSTSSGERDRALWLGLFLTAAWLIFLRFGYAWLPSPALAYIVSPATIALVLWQESKLAGRVYARPSPPRHGVGLPLVGASR